MRRLVTILLSCQVAASVHVAPTEAAIPTCAPTLVSFTAEELTPVPFSEMAEDSIPEPLAVVEHAILQAVVAERYEDIASLSLLRDHLHSLAVPNATSVNLGALYSCCLGVMCQ